MTVLTPEQIVAAPDGKTFRVTHYLGEGYTSRVYKAESLPDGQPIVALKVLKPDLSDIFVQSFRDEADILSLLRLAERKVNDGLSLIPGVVSRATDSDAAVRFLAIDFVQGDSVLDMLEKGPLPESMVLTIADQVLRVLDLLHTELRRSYTDFQLRNIWWQADKRQIMLMDWNHVSRPAPEGQLPPGVVDDLVRLGAFLYQLATGKGAMQTGETAGALAVRAGNRWAALSVGTRAIIETALHPNREHRFATAAEFRRAVRVQQTLWDQDEDDLHDDAVDAMRAVRNEEAQRDPILVRKAATLVDLLNRRQPTELTGKWGAELERLTDQVSAAWGSGRQYYRAGLYSEALKLWPDEAAAWGRPDLWRWVILARQGVADISGFEQHRADYERGLQLLHGQHWTEAENRLKDLPEGPSDDLRREARVHQWLSRAELAERDRQWSEAEKAYQNAAKLLAEIAEEGYRASLREVFGWDDLERRAEAARLRGQQMAADEAVVEELRDSALAYADFNSRALAGLRANPANLGLIALIAERATNEELLPHERRELALLGLQFGNPPPDSSKRLREALGAADAALDAIEARRIADEEAAARQRQAEIEREKAEQEAAEQRIREQARLAELEKQQLAAEEEARRLAEVERQNQLVKLRNDFTNRDYNSMLVSAAAVGVADFPGDIRNVLAREFKSAVEQGDLKLALPLGDILNSVDESGRAAREKEVRRRLETEFKEALKRQQFDLAGQYIQLLDRVDANGTADRTAKLTNARNRNEAEEQKARAAAQAAVLAIGKYVGQATTARDYDKWSAANGQASTELKKLEALLQNNNQTELLTLEALDNLRRDVAAANNAPPPRQDKGLAIGPPDGSLPSEPQSAERGLMDSIRAWLGRWWPVLLVAVVMFGAGIGAGFLLGDGRSREEEGQAVAAMQTVEAVAVMTQTSEAALALVPPTATSSPTSTATPSLTPTVAPSDIPSPTDVPPPTPLPTIDLLPVGRSVPVPAAGGDPAAPPAYFDAPDLALNAPTDWRFNWGGEDVQLFDPQGTPWTLYLAVAGPDGPATPAPVPVTIAGIDPPADATPTPEGTPAPTEATTVLLQWSRLADAAPLSPADYTFTFSLYGPDETMREVAPLPTVHVVAPPTVVVVESITNEDGSSEPGRVRELPKWIKACDLIVEPNVAGLPVEVLGKSIVSQVGSGIPNPRSDAIFLLVRVPNTTRRTYWLPDSDVAAGSLPDLTLIADVIPATGECDPNN